MKYVEQLWRYPVKSMAGEPIEEARLGPSGIPGDRGLVVTDAAGRILTARQKPGLLRLRATLDPRGEARVDGLHWKSDEVASRVRAAAGEGARLVPAPGAGRFDILPLLVTTDGAIAALGVDPRRLRPNLVVGGVAGLEERNWEGRFLVIGDAVIGLADLRARCIMTTYDPDTGSQDIGVLRRIHDRFDGLFGLNAWVARPGLVRTGAALELIDHFKEARPPEFGRFAG